MIFMLKVIKNGLVITMDEKSGSKIEKLDIILKDDIIYDITSNYSGFCDEVIDASGKIVLPGLINAHTHLGMSIFRATNDDLTLQDWLTKKIWPIEDKMVDSDIYYAVLLSCMEMIMTGTTCCNDMYFGWKGTMRAIEETGFRISMSRCLIGDSDSDGIDKINDFRSLVNEYRDNDMVSFTVSPHAIYTCTFDYLKRCSYLAKEYGFPVHIHFCENEDEVIKIRRDYGISPVKVLDKLGFLDSKLILAHGTFIDNDDQKLLSMNDVSIVTNPISNLNLGCGIADITSYLKNGINVCLGTDGQGSGNNLNLFKHMAYVADLQKAMYKDPTVMSSYDVLKMATINGAKALGLGDRIGSIEVGKQADLVILDLNKVFTFPTPDLIPQIVHNVEASNIDTTIINGKVVYSHGNFCFDVDFNDLMDKVTRIYTRLKI